MTPPDWLTVAGVAVVVGLVVAAALVKNKAARAALGGAALAIAGALLGREFTKTDKSSDATESPESDSSDLDDVVPIPNPATSVDNAVHDAENDIAAIPSVDLDDLATEYDKRTNDD